MARILIVLLVAILAAAAGGPVAAQSRDLSRVRILAVAPFADDDPTTRPLAEHGAVRLSALLQGGRFQIIDAARVASEMERAGVKAPALISPTQTVTLGMRLGADAVLTGRVVQIFQERQRERTNGPGGFHLESRVVIDVRVLEVSTRLKLLEDEFGCTLPFLAVAAMECVVREVAARLRDARN
ncbi:MAG TPA: hypothetical protein VFM39_08805 [bacterium]|nr:hypothetical protein [bacterium]